MLRTATTSIRGTTLSVHGPRGTRALALARSRDPEADALDRIALELTMPVDVDGEDRPRVVFYAYAHDSYDGQHRMPVDAAKEAIAQQGIKDRLRADTAAAVARGVFGLPAFFVGDELFWGHDRLDFVARAALPPS